MTIKSFKEHAEINENPLKPLLQPAWDAAKPIVKNYVKKTVVPFVKDKLYKYGGLAPVAGGGVAKAVEIGSKMKTPSSTNNPSRKYKGNPYSTPRRSTTNMKPNTAYSPTKSSAKGQAEDVKLDEKNPPEAHVARSKKNPDMFCVFDKDGKEVKLFKDKKDAEAYAVKNHDELMGESLWANIHKRRKAGKAPKKPGDKGYPKTLDIEAKENYVSNAQRAAVWANRADGGKGHPDNKKKSKKESGYKPFPKAGKKPLYGNNVDEISRDDMVKKVSSTIGSKVPMMINPQDKEKNKIKTGLDRLRKALGPNHVMNKTRA